MEKIKRLFVILFLPCVFMIQSPAQTHLLVQNDPKVTEDVTLFINTAVKHTLSGYVRDAGSRESLIGVYIYLPAQKTGTTTNNYGFYSLTLPEGKYEIEFSYIGYRKITKSIDLVKDLEINISLAQQTEISGVEIVGEKVDKVSNTSRMSMIELPVKQIRDIPALLGEKDVFKVIQLMPGVQKGNEGSSGFYVRGGGPDQNLIILDDAIVYNANHLFGFFSVFNGDAIKSIEFTKGGFPARYGGRLSSVLDITMKDGTKEKFSGEGGVGLISSRLTLEGPMLKGKSSFLVSGRRTYVDILMMPFVAAESDGGLAGYFFYDLNAKANYEFSQKDRIYLSAYFGRDKFYSVFRESDYKDKAGLFWGNYTATLRWNHQFNPRTFSNTSLIFSRYLMKIYEKLDYDNYPDFELDYSSGITDLAAKQDMTWCPDPAHTVRYGLFVTEHFFRPSAVVIKDPSINKYESKARMITSLEGAVYAEDDFKITPDLRVNYGLRVSDFINVPTHYLNLEPRMSASYNLKKDLAVKLSFAGMTQNVHLLSSTGIGLPTDLWVPSTKRTRPELSKQLAAGLAKDIAKNDLALTLEAYYKTSDHVIAYKEGASFLYIDDPEGAEEIDWEDNITSGTSWSYGAEIFLQKKTGRLTGWIGYTLSWTKMKFGELNFGNEFFPRYDRRHDISIVAIYKINSSVKLSGTWVYGTGNAISLPVAEFPAISPNTDMYYGSPWFYQVYQYYGKKNNYRMQAYHRLDLSLQFIKNRKHGTRTWELGVYNAYSRKNPFFYYISNDADRNKLYKVSLFPIIPSISYNFTF